MLTSSCLPDMVASVALCKQVKKEDSGPSGRHS
jgi:hypothetical protein